MRRAKFKHRSKMSKGKSKRVFKKAAKRVHKKNVGGYVMRGGIRL